MKLSGNFNWAVRQLVKRPAFSLAVIVTLGLGIGANAAIFSMFHQILLDPLPVPGPERLVNLESPGVKSGSLSSVTAGGPEAVFSYPMFRDLQSAQEAQEAFTGIAAHLNFDANFAFEGRTTSGEGLLVSGSYFPVLNIAPAAGRLLDPGDDRVVGEGRVAVISHDFWINQFDGDPDVVGRTLRVNGQALNIVGVAPAGFRGTTLGNDPGVYVPITLRWLMMPRQPDDSEDRRSYWVYLFARLAPGVSSDEAELAINGPYRGILADVEAPLQSGMSEETLQRFVDRSIRLVPGHLGQSTVREQGLAPLSLLMTVSGLVLLIACVNVANLLLLRGAGRSAELAIRASIGAGRGRLVMQLMSESLVLAVLGGVAGIAFAAATLRLMSSLLPPFATVGIDLGVSPFVMLAAMGLAGASLFVFGLLPALSAARVQPATVLRGQAGQPGGGRGLARFRNGLVMVQIAMSMTLLILAGLFAKSLLNVNAADLGMRVDSVVTFGVAPAQNGYSPERSMQLYRDIEEELAALPGVQSASSSMVPLLTDSNWRNNVSVEGYAPTPESDEHASTNDVGPAYFDTLGIPLLAGRTFTEDDAGDSPAVAIVSRRFAEKFGLGDDAIGKRMAIGATEDLDMEIVGVVADARYSNVKDEAPAMYYRPNRQNDNLSAMTFYARTATAPQAVMAGIRDMVARLDADLPVENLSTLPTVVRQNVFLDRFVGVLSTAFAVLATLLAAIGLYGVLAYSIAQRTRELGLRMALGAAPGRVWGGVLGRVGLMTFVGAAVGVAAAVVIGRFAESVLYQLSARDPLVMIAAVVVLGTVALGAGFVPARRAARINPNEALRYE